MNGYARVEQNGNIYFGFLDQGQFFPLEGDLFGKHQIKSQALTGTFKILAPLVPVASYAIGLNYRDHAEEVGAKLPERPVVFAKMFNTLQNPEDPILIPKQAGCEKMDYECELAVVIGKVCKNVTESEALDYVFGYTIANDVSARDWQLEWGGGQWIRGKSFDTFMPLGPVIVKADKVDPQSLAISTKVNGEIRQSGNTNNMIFSVAKLIAFLSQGTTLWPGTVILTGTPSGVAAAMKPPRWLKEGDEVIIAIEGIGELKNKVANSR